MRTAYKNKMCLTLTLFICCAVFPFSFVHAMGLKENSVVSDNTIKLGDIFYGLPRDEDRVLGTAPRPGQDLTLNARTLLKIAVALDLPWRPSSNADFVTLRRDATVIEYDQIKESLYTALYDEGVYGDFEVSIPNQYQSIILPADQPADMAITRINLDSNRKSFTASIVAPSRENPIQQFNIKGRIESVMNIPVLTSNIQNGRLITENDVEYIKVQERDFSQDMIVDAQTLLGMTARRMIIAGRPIKGGDLVAAQIVERGSLITLSLQSGVLNLTTQVKALQNGAKGDVIRVVNTASNKTLQATVTGENAVAVVTN